MVDFARFVHSKILCTWCAAYQDQMAWIYTPFEHYAFLRDSLNMLHQAGQLSLELRNELTLAAWASFQFACQRAELSEICYQYRYLYDLMDGETKVGEVDTESRFKLYGPAPCSGLISPRYQHEGEWELRGYVEYVATVFGVVRGLEVELADGRRLHMRRATPAHLITRWADRRQ
ncbi:hypothetical protein [Metapseudomonas otitidis]|uniref:hypothetical protein n=1 Tax=Metapseudomonas otitidis TaxID=319939 RepID=UPI001AAE5544|nr:hypothetical protein [Pseudomonas otitidis]MBO2925974.1 hypothetical protein [Pseudomonas otitidis]